GGEERVARQHASGRLTVRERVERLVDDATFHERGALAGVGRYEDGQLVDFLPANMVVGWARLAGRRVAIQADDFTVRGGEAADEDDALDQLRRFLSYLPDNVWEAPPVAAAGDPPDRREAELLEIVPRDRRQPYKVRRLLEAVLDRGSVFELGARYGRSLVTALARLDGRPVGVLASDPQHHAGGLTAAGSDQLGRSVDLCDQFHLPVV